MPPAEGYRIERRFEHLWPRDGALSVSLSRSKPKRGSNTALSATHPPPLTTDPSIHPCARPIGSDSAQGLAPWEGTGRQPLCKCCRRPPMHDDAAFQFYDLGIRPRSLNSTTPGASHFQGQKEGIQVLWSLLAMLLHDEEWISFFFFSRTLLRWANFS